jgi:hypothetical protein
MAVELGRHLEVFPAAGTHEVSNRIAGIEEALGKGVATNLLRGVILSRARAQASLRSRKRLRRFFRV